MGEFTGSKDMKNIGLLLLGLFLIAVIVAVTYVGTGELKSTLCTQADSTFEFENNVCYNASGANASKRAAQTITSITKVAIVEAAIDTVLGLLALVVIMLIFMIVIKVAKGFAGRTS